MSTDELPLPRPRWWNEMVTSLRAAGFGVDAALRAVRAIERHVLAAEQRGREAANENGELASRQLIADAEERGRQAGLAEAIEKIQVLKAGRT